MQRWLREPVARTREIRLEFLVKLYFARRIDDDLARRLIAEQQETFVRLEESLSSQLTALDVQSEVDDQQFSRLVLELRVAQTRAAIEWLGRAANS